MADGKNYSQELNYTYACCMTEKRWYSSPMTRQVCVWEALRAILRDGHACYYIVCITGALLWGLWCIRRDVLGIISGLWQKRQRQMTVVGAAIAPGRKGMTMADMVTGRLLLYLILIHGMKMTLTRRVLMDISNKQPRLEDGTMAAWHPDSLTGDSDRDSDGNMTLLLLWRLVWY